MMKGMPILILVALAGHFTLCNQRLGAKTPIRTRLLGQTPAGVPNERRLNFDDELQTGSLYTQQLENTNANLNEMNGHSRLQSSMKKIGQWFGDIEERLDDFRDGVSRKLNELHMSLQRPKIPIMGPAAMMLHPSMNPIISSSMGGPGANFMSDASMTGPQIRSQYSALMNNSQIGNAPMRSSPGSIASKFYQSTNGSTPDRRLYQKKRGLNRRGIL